MVSRMPVATGPIHPYRRITDDARPTSIFVMASRTAIVTAITRSAGTPGTTIAFPVGFFSHATIGGTAA